jgi:hypothetical protein
MTSVSSVILSAPVGAESDPCAADSFPPAALPESPKQRIDEANDRFREFLKCEWNAAALGGACRVKRHDPR